MSDHKDRVALGIEIIKKDRDERQRNSALLPSLGVDRITQLEQADALDAILVELAGGPKIPEEVTKPGQLPASFFDGPIHQWFSLSYAHYLVLPRTLLQAMPMEWQERLVALLEELTATFTWTPQESWFYFVSAAFQDDDGHFRTVDGEEDGEVLLDEIGKHDRLADYRHPDLEYLESIRVEKEELERVGKEQEKRSLREEFPNAIHGTCQLNPPEQKEAGE